ncbi:MAG: hypothetical protein ABFS19_05810 [Thermodesulfobacteriota bacterium]
MHVQPAAADECGKCGVIFGRLAKINERKVFEAIALFHKIDFAESKKCLENISTSERDVIVEINKIKEQINIEVNNLRTILAAQKEFEGSVFFKTKNVFDTFCKKINDIKTTSQDLIDLKRLLTGRAKLLWNKIVQQDYNEFCPRCRKTLTFGEPFCFHCGYEHKQSNNQAIACEFPGFQNNFSVGDEKTGGDLLGRVAGTYNEEENFINGFCQGEMTIALYGSGLKITAGSSSSACTLDIHFAQLVDIQYLNRHLLAQKTSKKKSVIRRTLIGGLLLGGVGSVAGAASGLAQTNTTENDYLLIRYWDQSTREVKPVLMSGCNQKSQYLQFVSMIREKSVAYLIDSLTPGPEMRSLLKSNQVLMNMKGNRDNQDSSKDYLPATDNGGR